MTRLGWISFFILMAIDIVLRRLYHPITEVTFISLGIGLSFSVFFWSFIDLVLRRLSGFTAQLTIGAIAAFWVVLVGSQITAFMRFGEYVEFVRS